MEGNSKQTSPGYYSPSDEKDMNDIGSPLYLKPRHKLFQTTNQSKEGSGTPKKTEPNSSNFCFRGIINAINYRISDDQSDKEEHSEYNQLGPIQTDNSRTSTPPEENDINI